MASRIKRRTGSKRAAVVVVWRSSVTGRFVSKAYARAHPATTQGHHLCKPLS
jgi:hypothetical protein